MENGQGPARPRFTPAQACLNCGDPTFGNYCPTCGQAKRDVAVSVTALVADVLEDQFVLSRALPRTLRALVLRPGYLTREYVAGRRVRYIAPFRLYLASSVVFFLLFSVFGLGSMDRGGPAPTAGAAGRAADSTASATGGRPGAGRGVAQAPDSAGPAAGGGSSDEVTSRGREIQPWARTMEINVGSEETNRRVRQRTIDRFGDLPPLQALRAFLAEYIRYAPQTVFLLLPLFALILKVLYVRSGRFYAEHFVFSLHVHAFVFAVASLGLLFGWRLALTLLGVAVTVYVWLALRRVYGQGRVRTTVKAVALGLTYGFFLSIAFTGTIVVTLLRL